MKLSKIKSTDNSLKIYSKKLSKMNRCKNYSLSKIWLNYKPWRALSAIVFRFGVIEIK